MERCTTTGDQSGLSHPRTYSAGYGQSSAAGNRNATRLDLKSRHRRRGPLRILTLYLKAPAWPKGVGDHDKALELLEKAAKTHSGHPLNHLFYARSAVG